MATFDTVFVQPTEKELTQTVTGVVKSLNGRGRGGRLDLGASQLRRFWKTVTAQPEGRRQWNGPPLANPNQRNHTLVVTAWWTDRLGRKHVRVAGQRGVFGEALENLLCPDRERRRPLWLVYPELIYFSGRGEKQRMIAACPCGVAGTPEEIGWMGSCCAACHDRRESGEMQAAPNSPLPRTANRLSTQPLGALAFSSDGRKVAAGELKGRRVAVWDWPSGDVRVRECNGTIGGLAFQPQGSLLALGEGRGVTLWNPQTNEVERTFQTDHPGVGRVTFYPDGSAVVADDGSGEAPVWNMRTGQQQPCFPSAADSISCVAFSPQGDLLALGTHPPTVTLVDRTSGQVRGTWEVPQFEVVYMLAFSPNGRFLAAADFAASPSVLWEIATGRMRTTPLRHQPSYSWNALSLEVLAFAPDSHSLAAPGADGPEGEVTFWDLTKEGDEPIGLSWSPGHSVVSVAFSPDGQWLATAGYDGWVKLWPWRALLDVAKRD
jgi:WD40 repeat protein